MRLKVTGNEGRERFATTGKKASRQSPNLELSNYMSLTLKS